MKNLIINCHPMSNFQNGKEITIKRPFEQYWIEKLIIKIAKSQQ